MKERQKRLGKFLVAGGDPSKMLETSEKTLDQIVIAVELAIEVAGCKAVGSGRDYRCGASGFDYGHDMIGVVPLVGHDRLSGQFLDQCRGVVDIGE